ncbi:zinc finger BED domain-containing 1-like [Brachionus plicatilis]|uniref:Zinc finger BED domain-containing 1-like n=1 Tax=Brachionus plicatilis TaxID=10195 RepID=A0A3M7QW39_BRAPC|nr:zinc finger BED domain-containing 1-like [Brachionus plicatilis]
MLAKFHNKHVLPSSRKLTDTLALSVTPDCWTSPANDPYMGLTCHYIDNDDQLQKIPIALKYVPESHSSENLASICREFSMIIISNTKTEIVKNNMIDSSNESLKTLIT